MICFGAPLVDIIFPIAASLLSTIGGKEGGMELISENKYIQLKELAKPIARSIGGSALNVAKGLAQAKHNVSFYGTIGNDPNGQWLFDELTGLAIDPNLTIVEIPTGSCLSFVTPDAKRTLRTFLGASQAIQFKKELIDWNSVNLCHFEGYLVDRKDFLNIAIAEVKKHEILVSLDVGSFEMVENYFYLLNFLIETGVDILFCNEQEAEKLTQLSPKEACHYLSKKASIAVVSSGASGGYVGHLGKVFHYEPYPAHVVDTTGAGDYFAAGFLAAFLENKTLRESAQNGAKLASHIISFFGT